MSASENPPVFWNVDFFRDDDGNLPVRKWLETMPEDVRGKVIARLDLLKQGGPTLDFPYTSQIEGRLREVRLRVGKTRYRVLYFSTMNVRRFCCMGSQRTLQLSRKLTNVSGAREWRNTKLA